MALWVSWVVCHAALGTEHYLVAVRSVIRYYEAKAADTARAEQARREAQAKLVAGNPQLNAFTPIGTGQKQGNDTFRSPYDFSGGGKPGRDGGRPSSARTAPPLGQIPPGQYVPWRGTVGGWGGSRGRAQLVAYTLTRHVARRCACVLPVSVAIVAGRKGSGRQLNRRLTLDIVGGSFAPHLLGDAGSDTVAQVLEEVGLADTYAPTLRVAATQHAIVMRVLTKPR